MTRRMTIAMAALLLVAGAFAQSRKPAAEKTVTGVVTDASGAPVPGAVVQLENMKTLQIQSFIAKEKGEYYFHGLAADVDYKISAQSNGKSSATRNISTFDSHMELTINLQLK